MSQFIPVGQDVRLEVLDWGGAGRPLVLLAGGGDTAHVFDDFAPRLTIDFHVYGITRRGFGESGFAPLTSGTDTFGDDVLAVLDALKLESPVLVGHSIGGQRAELDRHTLSEPRHRTRVSRCHLSLRLRQWQGTDDERDREVGFPQPPPPTEADLATFDALRHDQARVLGFMFPGRRTSSDSVSVTPEGRVGPTPSFPGGRV